MVWFLSISKKILKAIRLPLLVAVVTAQVLVPEPVCSESQPQVERQRAQKKSITEKITEGRQQVRKLNAKETTVIEELEQLNRKLNESQTQVGKIRRQIKHLRVQIASSNRKRNKLVEDIQGLETYAEQRLVAFYKLGGLGIVPFLFSADSFFDIWQRQQALGRIMEDDSRLWDELHGQETHLKVLSEELTTQKVKQDGLLARLKEQDAVVKEKRGERASLLAKIQSKKNLTIAAIESLEMTAKELDEAIRSLEHDQGPPSTGFGDETSTFLALKGSLPKPLPGKLVGLFGPYVDKSRYNLKGFRNGVNIEAGPRSPVRAVCNGRVIYAGWFKGYGNIIIIDHGEHYYTLSAQLEELFGNVGDVVGAGEVIGNVGDTGTAVGPGLYFEIRHHGKPKDPVVWFSR